MAKPELQAAHVLLTQPEIGKHIVDGVLRSQGIDPEKHTTTFTCAYRIVDGKILASIAIVDVAPTEKN